MTRKKVKTESKSEKLEELKNQLARALADYDNLRKRTEAEREILSKFASQRLVVKFLPILDILESAQDHLKDQGLAMAIDQFKNVLREEGIEEINPKKGEDFNPELHEAVESVDGGKHGQIAETILPGWKYSDGPVIRIAKVKVYAEKIEKEKELEKEISRGEYV